MLTLTAPLAWRAISPVSSVTSWAPKRKDCVFVGLTILTFSFLLSLQKLKAPTPAWPRGALLCPAIHAGATRAASGSRCGCTVVVIDPATHHSPHSGCGLRPRQSRGTGSQAGQQHGRVLTAQAQFADQCFVARRITAFDIIQQLAPFVDHFQQATT